MSGLAKDEHGVNRLLDIVVEEVSLVDRAANKHRFLIVKRSDEMDDTTTELTATQADEATADTEPAGVSDSNSDAGGAGGNAADGGDASGGPTDSAPLSVAIAALEGLTETVELLGTLGEDGAAPRLTELATELRDVSDQLARAAGDEPDASTDAGDAADAGDTADTAGDGDSAAITSVIETVRATLERVGGLLETGGDPDAKADANAADDAADSAAADGDDTSEPLAALATELRALTDAVKAQQQRLARLEKRFGLPNSAPSGERPPRAGDEEVGWPMDLNRAFDRESVDKSISFHDV